MRKYETAESRDQQADARESVNMSVECGDEQCDTSEQWKHIKESEDWQVSNDPKVPLLCPECADRVPDISLTPTEMREKYNTELTDYGGNR